MKSPWAIPDDPRLYEGDPHALRELQEEYEDERRAQIEDEYDAEVISQLP